MAKAATTNVATLPSRTAPVPTPAPMDTPVPIGRNVHFLLEGDDTLVILVNISDAAVQMAPMSDKGNPVLATTGGFKYYSNVLASGTDIGISVNIISKPTR